MCVLQTSAYELSIAPPAFLRGYWTAYCARPAIGIAAHCRELYDKGFRAGSADRAELERLWKRFSEWAAEELKR